MKRPVFVIAVLGAFFSSWSWADSVPVTGSTVAWTSPPSLSTAPAVVVITTYPVTFGDIGETISTPTPNAMTAPPAPLSLFTLTRTRLPLDQAPMNVSRVDPEKALAFDAQNAGEMLAHEPGLLIQPQAEGSYPLYAQIRGGTNAETLVLIDGRPMEGASLGPADLSEIPIEQIDHIEVVRGGLSALYGPNALAGVINVITKRAAYTGYPISHVSYESASYSRQTYRLDYGSRQGPLDYFFFGNQEWESGFRDNTTHRLYNIGGNAGLALGTKGKILVDVASYHNNAGVPGFRCDDIHDPSCPGNNTTPLEPNRFNNKDEKGGVTPNAREITDSNYIRGSYLVSFSTHVYLATRLYSQVREADYDNSTPTNPSTLASTDRKEHTNGGEVQLNLPFELLTGASFAHDHEDFLDRISNGNSFSATEENWGVFAQQTWAWRALSIIPSGRYDKTSQSGDSSNPRVQGLLKAEDWLNFSADAGRSFRAPTIDERTTIPSQNYIGNANLEPETAWTYNAGFELHESSKSLRVNYFRANVEHTIQTFVPQVPSNPASPLTAVNLDHSRRQGMELEINHVFGARFRDTWNYTYLENLGTPAGYDHLVALAYSPRHTVNYSAVFIPKKKWEIDPTVRFEDARFSGNDNGGTKMGSQVILDLRLAYQWRQMDLYLGVKDVTDKRYQEQPGYPLPGRTVFLGLKLRLWG